MNARAGIVVTGTEVLTGRIADSNGPWLAEQLREQGVDVSHVVVVGDRPNDVRAALEFVAGTGVALLITTGGLGPTADDLTAEVVGRFCGRPAQLDTALEAQIAGIVAALAQRRGRQSDAAATAAGTRKQALVPVGAHVLTPVGTAPGLVVPPGPGRAGPPVLVLPGPPGELRGMWPAALSDPLVAGAFAGATPIRQRTQRLWGVGEPEIAATLRRHEAQLAGLEITTCLRGGELEIVTRFDPQHEATYDRWAETVRASYPDGWFSDGATIDELVADELLRRGLRIATAESCTAGLLAARLTERPGSSDYVRGGLVVYSNDAKHALAEVPAELITTVGAVSAEVAAALAEGARNRLGADVGVGITGVAGPGGGSADKPVGLVHLCAAGLGRTAPRRVLLPGNRAAVRQRAVEVALHLVRELLRAAQ